MLTEHDRYVYGEEDEIDEIALATEDRHCGSLEVFGTRNA